VRGVSWLRVSKGVMVAVNEGDVEIKLELEARVELPICAKSIIVIVLVVCGDDVGFMVPRC
jgi:hypothetical protein